MSDPINLRPDATGTQNLIISNNARPLIRQVSVVTPHASNQPSLDDANPVNQPRVKERRQSDRRQTNRRQQNLPCILDTRSTQERRRENRRQSDKNRQAVNSVSSEIDSTDDVVCMGFEAIV